jgi:hypothetical protein
MCVRIIEARDDRPAADVDHGGAIPAMTYDLLLRSDGEEATILDGHRGGKRAALVLGGDAAVHEDHVRFRTLAGGCLG